MSAGDFRVTQVIRIGLGVVEFTIVMDLGPVVSKFWIHLYPNNNLNITVLPADPEWWDFCGFCLATITPYLCLLGTHQKALEGKLFPYSKNAQGIADALLLFMR